jgi:cell wall-associated NlpC family hydrolase
MIGLCIAATVAHGPVARAEENGSAAPLGAEIVMSALSFLGVPYRMGGDDPERGFDCSGLVRQAVRLALGRDLPRRSAEMRGVGRPVRAESLQAGDLLFFNTLGRPFSHVALYIGEGRFVHAPARGGQVRVESMHIGYWRARFNGARRVGAGTPNVSRGSAIGEREARTPVSPDGPWDPQDGKP